MATETLTDELKAAQARIQQLEGILAARNGSNGADDLMTDSLYQALVENSPDFILIVDRDGKIQYLNRLTPGMTREQVIGLPAAAMIPPEYTETVQNAINDVFAGKSSVEYETLGPGPNGEVRWYETRVTPIHQNGQITYISMAATDITERKNALDALRRREHQYQQILDAIQDFVLVKGEKSSIVWANKSFREYYGMTEEELRGLIDAPFAEPDYTQQYVIDDAQVWNSGQPLDIQEEPVKRHDGVVKPFNTVKTPIFDENGNVVMTVGVSRDISGRKQAEAERERLFKELQAANRIAQENSRLKSEFLATMSHELRTPLNAIEGFTSIMLKKMGGAEYNQKTERYISKVQANSKRLLNLINDFLDLSRIEAGRIDLTRSAIFPAEMVRHWQEEVSVLADNKGLQFNVSLAPDLPEVIYGDEDAFSKIGMNLLSNAIKFTEQGSVTLSLQRQDQNWMIIVSDTGIGIPPHAREYIFDEFRQVDQSSKRKYGGTGLGLAIAQKLVRAMNGTIAVDSEVGKGTTFTITLPLLESLSQDGGL